MYFYREILPLIRQTIPTVKLYIVGKDPSPTVQKLASENVIVTGKVPDLRTYYSLAQVSICPIRLGAGTLNKVIEPMAMSSPVVSTSIFCVGMNVTPIQDPHFASADYQDQNIVFADTPQDICALSRQPPPPTRTSAKDWHSSDETSQSRTRLGKHRGKIRADLSGDS